MAEAAGTIQLSTFGREIRAGYLYNYFTDEIFSEPDSNHLKIESNNMTPKIIRSFFYQEREEFKHSILFGSNYAHFEASKKFGKGELDLNQNWFANFVEKDLTDDTKAQVSVFLRVIKRTENVEKNSLMVLINQCQLKADGKATHLVNQVVYGTEFICVIEMPINYSLRQTKAKIEQNIYWAVKSYFDQLDNFNGFNVPIVPAELKKSQTTCTIYSSCFELQRNPCTFVEFAQILSDTINDRSNEKPIQIGLYFVPLQIESRLSLEKRKSFELEKKRQHFLIEKIFRDSQSINKYIGLDRVPPLERTACHSLDLIRTLKSKIGTFIKTIYGEQQNIEELNRISNLLTKISDWLIYFRQEIKKVFSLLEGTQLIMLDYEQIKSFVPLNDEKFVRVFILNIDYTTDCVMEEIQQEVGEFKPVFQFPKFKIFNQIEENIRQVKRKLHEFADKALLYKDSTILHYIGLVTAPSLFDDGFVDTINCCNKIEDQNTLNYSSTELSPDSSSADCQEHKKHEMVNDDNSVRTDNSQGMDTLNEQMDVQVSSDESDGQERNFSQIPSYTDVSSSNLYPASAFSENRSDISQETTGTTSTQQEETSFESENREEISNTNVTELIENFGKLSVAERLERNCNNRASLTEDETSQDSEQPSYLSCHEDDDDLTGEKVNKHETIGTCCEIASQMQNEEPNDEPKVLKSVKAKLLSTQRIAEIFLEEDYSTQISLDQPNVYLLNAEEFTVGNDLRWFDIAFNKKHTHNQQFSIENHKVIILMGATGCGKSTLINGMVNYILGVKWEDLFRFKIIRDDESAAGQDQSHSQTSSVTAYTLHHHDGMTVPYSVTIIDTPGYGDTQGVQRDKEITQLIHRFLTRPETQINQIHAVCFVAASGDSRLTVTQRYILDSVLSTFGKDVKNNIRLLVTFADNADPPVVNACLGANFPVTSRSVGITYSKFNSSVLYASNEKQEEDESFDELFWDMGQENFQKFFEMLKGMKGCDLTSTREVIQRRQQAEQTFKDIDQQLEVCLLKIENIEIFTRKLKGYNHMVEANKDYLIETKEVRLIRMNCKIGWAAYNCVHCRKTCEDPVKLKSYDMEKNSGRPCTVSSCKCKPSDHKFQNFYWRSKIETVKKTLNEMKTEYQLNFDRKMSTEEMLVQCSEDLSMAKGKVLSLLSQLEENAHSLDSTALRSNALSPADYLSLMRSRVAEEQTPGYMTRLDTISELQRCLAAQVSYDQMTGHYYGGYSNYSSQMRGSSTSNTYELSQSSLQATSGKTAGFERDYQPSSTSETAYNSNQQPRGATTFTGRNYTREIREVAPPNEKENKRKSWLHKFSPW